MWLTCTVIKVEGSNYLYGGRGALMCRSRPGHRLDLELWPWLRSRPGHGLDLEQGHGSDLDLDLAAV